MNGVQVVCVSSRVPTEPYYHFGTFLESLKRFGVTPVVLGMEEAWHGLMTKPNLLRDWLRAGKNASERLIVCDAWDVVFTAHPDEIDVRCADLFGEAILFNAEKACWPRAELAERFPDTGSPWRYLNSGFQCGPAEKLLAMLEWMDLDAVGVDRRNAEDTAWIYPDDQGQTQLAYVAQPVAMVVDTECTIAQTLSACEMDEFDLSAEQIFNRVTGTWPDVFHFNGGSKELMMPGMLAKWGLA